MAWWDHAQPGDPVVCVDATDYDFEYRPEIGDPVWPLKQGAVYRFGRIVFDETPVLFGKVWGSNVSLLLIDIPNPFMFHGGFAPERFRPAQSTDLPESLRKCLDAPAPARKLEDAT